MVYLITVIPLLAQNNLIGDQGLINNMHSTDSTEAPPWRPWVKTYARGLIDHHHSKVVKCTSSKKSISIYIFFVGWAKSPSAA